MEEQIKKLQQRIQELEDKKGFQLSYPLDVESARIVKAIAKLNSKARYYLGTNQVLTTATWTKIQLDTKTYDSKGEFSNYKFTATQAGYYLAIGNAQLDSAQASGDVLYLDIYKNGSAVATNWTVAPDLIKIYASVSDIIYLEAGDYIELWAQQETGSDQSIVAGSSITYLTIHKLS